MGEHELRMYRTTLLKAGLGYRWVNRHVQELVDHYQDLVSQELQSGHDAASAASKAAGKLGKLDELAAGVIATARPMLLHRRPLLMATLLPALAFLLSCVLLTLLVIGVVWSLSLLTDAVPRPRAAWLDALVTTVVWLHLYVALPLAGIALSLTAIRNHVPAPYWVAGMVLLCVIGSGTYIHIELPDEAVQRQGMVGFSLFYPGIGLPGPLGPSAEGNVGRLLVNLLLTGAFALWMFRRERQTEVAAGV